MKTVNVPSNLITMGSSEFVPPENQIPEEFWSMSNKWRKLALSIYFHGADFNLKAKRNVNTFDAMNMVVATLSCNHIPHQYKIAGSAFMLSEFFDI